MEMSVRPNLANTRFLKKTRRIFSVSTVATLVVCALSAKTFQLDGLSLEDSKPNYFEYRK